MNLTSSASYHLFQTRLFHISFYRIFREHSFLYFDQFFDIVVEGIFSFSGVAPVLAAKSFCRSKRKVPVNIFRSKGAGSILLLVPFWELLPLVKVLMNFVHIHLLGIVHTGNWLALDDGSFSNVLCNVNDVFVFYRIRGLSKLRDGFPCVLYDYRHFFLRLFLICPLESNVQLWSGLHVFYFPSYGQKPISFLPHELIDCMDNNPEVVRFAGQILRSIGT
mmetsp:Transcript_27081/g.65831  ORF Transcript_27081/g.65831 Transcript_27081/m.65831 type:complete len:220 (-) Transcript_27081:1095-1754(-)